jgi:ATP-dependent Clp protease ATP-binding subunit ClpC
MEAKFSQRVKDVLSFSREEAVRLGNDYIGVEHLLLGIIREGEGLALRILGYLNVDLTDVRKVIETAIANQVKRERESENLPLVKQAERALKLTYLEAKLFNSELIGTEHLLLAILKDDDNLVTRSLHKYNVSYDIVKDEIKSYLLSLDEGTFHEPKESGKRESNDFRDELPGGAQDEDPDEGGGLGGLKKQGESKSKTPVFGQLWP